MKLFNLLVNDLGPIFLKQGILLKKKQLEDFFDSRSADFWPSLKSAYLDSHKINLDTWSEIKLPDLLLLVAEPGEIS